MKEKRDNNNAQMAVYCCMLHIRSDFYTHLFLQCYIYNMGFCKKKKRIRKNIYYKMEVFFLLYDKFIVFNRVSNLT